MAKSPVSLCFGVKFVSMHDRMCKFLRKRTCFSNSFLICHYMAVRFFIGWLSNGQYTTPSIQRGKFTSAWNLSYCNWKLYSGTNLYELNYVHCLSLFLVPLELHAAKNKSEKCKISDFVFIFFDLIMLEYAYNQFSLQVIFQWSEALLNNLIGRLACFTGLAWNLYLSEP